MLGIVPGGVIAAQANNNVVLATIQVGQIFEFRNTGSRDLVLEFVCDGNSFSDFYKYTGLGWSYRARRGARLHGWTIGTSPRPAAPSLLIRGGKTVIEHRSGQPVVVRGDASYIQVTQLVSPVFYVQRISEGVRLEFTGVGPGTGIHAHLVRFDSWEYPIRGSGPNAIDAYVIRPDGTTSATRPFSGSTIEPGNILVLNGRRHRNAAHRDWEVEVSGSFTAFSGQPYRLTIDGQRSFPPGREVDLPPITAPPTATPPASTPPTNQAPPTGNQQPPTNQPPTQNNRPIEQATQSIYDMINRTGGDLRPFDGFNAAFYEADLVARNQLGGRTNDEMRAAYYDVILAMLRNDHTRAAHFIENANPLGLEMIPVVGSRIQSAIGLFSPQVITVSPELTAEQVVLLMYLRQHATRHDLRHTNNRIMQEAVDQIIHNHTSVIELNRMQTSLLNALTSSADAVLSEVVKEVVDWAFSEAVGIALTPLRSVVSINNWARNIERRAFVTSYAIQDVRETVWRIWDVLVDYGQANEFTQDSLLRLNQMFELSRYLVVEQIAWAAVLMDGPRSVFNRGSTGERWSNNFWIQDDLHYLRLLQTPVNYPMFSQFNNMAMTLGGTRALQFVRFYNDGRYARVSALSNVRNAGLFEVVGNRIYVMRDDGHEYGDPFTTTRVGLRRAVNREYTHVRGLPANMLQGVSLHDRLGSAGAANTRRP